MTGQLDAPVKHVFGDPERLHGGIMQQSALAVGSIMNRND